MGVLLLTALVVSGCRRDEVQVYRVAKEQKPDTAAHVHTASEGRDDGALPALAWKLPNPNWEEAPAGQMRAASFRVKGAGGKLADVSVIPLPGMAGTDLSNVNRWRGQVGLPAVTEEELAKLAEPVEIDGAKAQLYDISGENPGSGDKTRILAAILRRNNVAWFFKMTGDDDLVAGEKKAFMSFLSSVHFEAADTMAGTMQTGTGSLPPDHPPLGGAGAGMGALPPDHPPLGAPPATSPSALPPDHPPIGAGSTSAQPTATVADSGHTPKWQVPGGWQSAPAGQFLVAKYNLTGEGDAQAAVNVSMSTGDGGGVEGNVNRWRRQLGLAEVAGGALGVSAFEAAGPGASMVEIAGADARTGQKAKILGVVVPGKGRTWFYKLMGAEALVDREKQAFLDFVRSAKYPDVP